MNRDEKMFEMIHKQKQTTGGVFKNETLPLTISFSIKNKKNYQKYKQTLINHHCSHHQKHQILVFFFEEIL